MQISRGNHCRIINGWNAKFSGYFWKTTVWKAFKCEVFSGLYFPTFGLNTERYRVSLRIQSDGGKIRTQKDSVFGHFWRSGRKQSFISPLSCLCSFCAMLQNCRDRSSRPVVFCKKGVLKALMRRATLLKKRLWHRCFPVDCLKFLRIPFLQNTSRGCFYWIFYPWD